jgi:hypothetical protein
MKWMPTQLGGTPKQMMWLGGLLVVLVVVWIVNNTGNSTPAPAPSATAGSPATGSSKPGGPRQVSPVPIPPRRQVAGSAASRGSTIKDFRPSLLLPEGVDVASINPALKVELLAKLRTVEVQGGSRSLFDFGQPPPPPPPDVKPIFVGPKMAPPGGANPSGDSKQAVASKPPTTPIPFKYYGFASVSRGGNRTAFFIDGEEIFIRGENDDLIRNRYKIVRIGVNSAVVEDTTDHHQETLKLVEEQTA